MANNSNGTNPVLQSTSNRSHPGHGYQSLVKDHHAIYSAEVTKFLKQNYTIPHDTKYQCEHIIRKTSQLRVPTIDPDQWRQNFVRRTNQLSEGFFTPQHKPYRPVGNVELKPHVLVCDVFSEGLNKQVPLPPVITGKFQSKLPTQADTSSSNKKVSLDAVKSHTGGNLDFSTADINTAGYTFIQENLVDSKQLLVANRGGQTYDKCFKEIEKLKKQQSSDLDQSSTLIFRRPWTPSQGDKSLMIPVVELHSVAISTTHDPKKQCSKAAALEEDLEAERERMIFNRTRRALIERLQAIQMIINALHNMKKGDLRTRVPLSLETVKMLYRDVLSEKPCTTTRVVKQVIQNDSNDTVSSGNAKMSKLSIQKKDQGDGPLSATPTFQWKKFHNKFQSHKRDLPIETWEDLMALSSPGGHHRNSMFPTAAGAMGGVHQKHWYPTANYAGGTDKQKLPLWQIVGAGAEDTVKMPSHNSKSNRHQHDPENTLKSLRESFTKVKKKMAREVQSDLERLFRDRMRTFRQKFHVITQSPLFEKTVQNLKEVSASQPVPVITDEENTEIKPSKWFIDLKSQAENTAGKDDPEVNKLIQQLSRFSLEDAKSIPNAKEKLCLLMMSMPAAQLLTIQTQEALKFVLEEILWAPVECFSEWLHHRKIPVVLFSQISASI